MCLNFCIRSTRAFFLLALVLQWPFLLNADQRTWFHPQFTSGNGAEVALKKNLNKTNLLNIPIKGKCYIGAGFDRKADSGKIYFCINSADSSTSSSPCVYIKESKFSANVSASGEFSSELSLNPGDYFIEVCFPPYAIQWFNNSSIHDQPAIVHITGDTITCEFHFKEGCGLKGSLSINNESATATDQMDLLDTCGLELFSQPYNGNISLDCIPVGTYYLRTEDHRSNYHYYPNSLSATDAQKIRFETPGQEITINWNIFDIVDTQSQPYSYLYINLPDSEKNIYAFVQYIGSGALDYISLNSVSSMTVLSDARFFLERVSNFYDKRNFSLSYYPGTFLRSKADTLTIATRKSITCTLPASPGGRISG